MIGWNVHLRIKEGVVEWISGGSTRISSTRRADGGIPISEVGVGSLGDNGSGRISTNSRAMKVGKIWHGGFVSKRG